MIEEAYGVLISKSVFNLNENVEAKILDDTIKYIQEKADASDCQIISIIGSKAVFIFETYEQARQFDKAIKVVAGDTEIKKMLVKTMEEC